MKEAHRIATFKRLLLGTSVALALGGTGVAVASQLHYSSPPTRPASPSSEATGDMVLIDASDAAWASNYRTIRNSRQAQPAARAVALPGIKASVQISANRDAQDRQLLCVSTKHLTDQVAVSACGLVDDAASHPVISVLGGFDGTIVSGPAPDDAASAQIILTTGETATVVISRNSYIAKVTGDVDTVRFLTADGGVIK